MARSPHATRKDPDSNGRREGKLILITFYYISITVIYIIESAQLNKRTVSVILNHDRLANVNLIDRPALLYSEPDPGHCSFWTL